MSKTPTQNDWENRYAKLIKDRSDYPGAYRNQDGFDCTPDEMKDFIDKAVADERKEVTADLKEAWLNEGPVPEYHRNAQQGLMLSWPTLYKAILATLREEKT